MDYLYTNVFIKWNLRKKFNRLLNKIARLEDNAEKNIRNIKTFRKEVGFLRQTTWVEIWNIETVITSLEYKNGLSWNMYLKYKLSMINSWHILEERFLVFFLLFIICFF